MAYSQSLDITVHDSVKTQVSIRGIQPGSTEEKTTLGSSIHANTLESSVPAVVRIETHEPLRITLSSPVLQAGARVDPAGTNRVSSLAFHSAFGSVYVRSDGVKSEAVLPVGVTDVEVSLWVERPEPFSPGNYTYLVQLAVSPE
jgi:hypothetical protein